MQENDGRFDLNSWHSARAEAKTDTEKSGMGNENGVNQFAESLKNLGRGCRR
jgi:hypothetical protein